jgi:hypothetical protein
VGRARIVRPKFAVIPFAACEELRALLADAEKRADSLDDLHIQKVKAQPPVWLTLAEVKAAAVACAAARRVDAYMRRDR